MEELSIEEKAKAYDEAIKRAKAMIPVAANQEEIYNSVITIFPELRESGNIRIIKAIKYGLDHVFTNNTTVFEVTKEQCLAWLEKQGEQKPAEEYNITGIGSKHAQGKLGEMIKNLKSAWSEEDENIIEWLIGYLEYQIMNVTITEEKNNCLNAISMLKSLKDRYTWKPSDEQMKALKEAVDEHFDIDGGALWHLYEDLKKLKG